MWGTRIRLRRKMSERKDHFEEGHTFEVYVANSLFPEPDFAVSHITTRRDDLGGRLVESAQNPDIEIRHRKSDHLFWVECKWRTSRSIRNCKLAVLTRNQLERYNSFQERERLHRVYVVVGLNGRPDSPSRLFCIPLKEFNNQPWPYLRMLVPFERSPAVPVSKRASPIRASNCSQTSQFMSVRM